MLAKFTRTGIVCKDLVAAITLVGSSEVTPITSSLSSYIASFLHLELNLYADLFALRVLPIERQ